MSAPKTERRKPVLIVQHAPHEHPAAVRRALESQGIQTLCIHPYRGEPYPPFPEIAGVISLGGPMGANDETDHPWIRAEIALMRASMDAGHPVVGICLGGQLLARAMGGKVEPNETHEVGWFPIEVTDEGRRDPILGTAGSNPTVYHWHGDTFHLPPGATLLARSRACPRQAYRIGRQAYGFQFHPEADHQLVGEWLGIEGVEGEIRDSQRRFGAKNVQNARTQRGRALQGEKASLKITAGIGSLFRRMGCRGHEPASRDQLAHWTTHGTRLRLEFEGPDRRAVRLQGRIQVLLAVHAGEFVIFKEESGLLWPVRLSDVARLEADG